jgi:3-phosphoshikimate 1-carboxyvinyltransferase
MKRSINPVRSCQGTLAVPGDKSIAHRAALLSILSRGPVSITNFPDNDDCRHSLQAAEAFGASVVRTEDGLRLVPPEQPVLPPDAIIDCGNSGTTARLLAGLIAGTGQEATISGDASLSRRPMKRIIEPLNQMGAEFFSDGGHLPMRVRGRKLMPIDYVLPVASAQVKSAILLAGLAAGCTSTVRERVLTRDHTERMIEALGSGLTVIDHKPVLEPDPDDPRRRRVVRPSDIRREITVGPQTFLRGGEVRIPGDISTAAFFWAAAAIGGGAVTINGVGLNPTRTGFLDHLKAIGCRVEISDRATISGEPRGNVTVQGQGLRSRKIAGDVTVSLIDEIPIVAVMAAFAEGTTIIRDAQELRVKESDRLEAVAHNLGLMGVKCGLLQDGLAIEGCKEHTGADFAAFDDHRIAMAFSIAALFLTGPSSIDNSSVVAVSCPAFYDLVRQLTS